MHPYITSQIASERRREKLARADQQRLTRHLAQQARTTRRAQHAHAHRIRRVIGTALRLRYEP